MKNGFYDKHTNRLPSVHLLWDFGNDSLHYTAVSAALSSALATTSLSGVAIPVAVLTALLCSLAFFTVSFVFVAVGVFFVCYYSKSSC